VEGNTKNAATCHHWGRDAVSRAADAQGTRVIVIGGAAASAMVIAGSSTGGEGPPRWVSTAAASRTKSPLRQWIAVVPAGPEHAAIGSAQLWGCLHAGVDGHARRA
jgi:hypothetical protein